MARDGRLFDYFDGTADLQVGRVRFVGDPPTRIAEDYLRILRFFRFYARYGRVQPVSATLAALRNGIPGLSRLSVERVWMELLCMWPRRTRKRRVDSAPRHLAAVLPERKRCPDAGFRLIQCCGWCDADRDHRAGGAAENVERGPRAAGASARDAQP